MQYYLKASIVLRCKTSKKLGNVSVNTTIFINANSTVFNYRVLVHALTPVELLKDDRICSRNISSI